MNDRRRPRVPAKPKPSPQLTGPVQLDDETRNALILFNARLVAQDELEREKRRVEKAAKAKDEAAAKVRQFESDPEATAEQKSEAQAGYLASLDALTRAKAGEPASGDAAEPDTDETADDAGGEPAKAEVEPAEAEAEAEAEPDPEADTDETADDAGDEPVEAEVEPAEAVPERAETEASAADPEAGDEP